jgi:hypothetical protein
VDGGLLEGPGVLSDLGGELLLQKGGEGAHGVSQSDMPGWCRGIPGQVLVERAVVPVAVKGAAVKVGGVDWELCARRWRCPRCRREGPA